MLTPTKLRALLDDLESDRVERTVATNNTDKFSRAVCAFANDLPNHGEPGFLLIGVDDAGRPNGLHVTDELLRNLAGLRADGNILPPPALQVYKVALPEGEVAVVEVPPSDFPPVRYKGRVCIRVGARRGEANEQEERMLAERRSALVSTFDLRPVPSADITELSLRLFREYRAGALPADVIEANHRSPEEQLAALRCFDLRRNLATVAGILLFGLNPRFFIPGAYVQVLRFSGTSATDLPVDQAELSGDLATVVQDLHARVRTYNSVRMENGENFRDRILPDYPETALRELLHNALMHRDYAATSPVRFYWFADRVEIWNPGGPMSPVTLETLTRSTAYRNPVLAEAMKNLGFVNRFGFGIQRAQRLLADNGNPPPSFEPTPLDFRVVVSSRPA